MKSKIAYLIAVVLAATLVIGCQRQSENNPPPAENPPGAQPGTNSAGSTNLSQANAPAVPGANSTNIPAPAKP
ncbi:MAG TPA: hypothetical protein VN836_03170 [Verrucomicrobiae bacterium]|nr:hypothetical protein [Verrucomicrobiae bacterium]